MKVLVTGGSGYFGSLLINKLLQNGYEVGSLDINKPKSIPKDVNFHKADIRDYENLEKALKGYKIIFHNVAQVPLAKNNSLFWDVNVNGTKNICESAVKNEIEKIVYTSSSAIYGIPKLNPVKEKAISTLLSMFYTAN